jgi:hypothetical protein
MGVAEGSAVVTHPHRRIGLDRRNRDETGSA